MGQTHTLRVHRHIGLLWFNYYFGLKTLLLKIFCPFDYYPSLCLLLLLTDNFPKLKIVTYLIIAFANLGLHTSILDVCV